EAANQAVSRPISEWTDYGDVARYGWKLDEDAEIDDAMGQDLLEAAFEKLNIDADKNEIIKIDQIVPVTVGGNEYEPSGAEYKCLFNVDAGMIVVENARSPELAKKDSTPMSAIVPLRQWSDVVFRLWENYTKGVPGGLRHLSHSVVANTQSLSIM
ncbi:hypothetical protein COH21_013044, partial [Aspergillus flavus]